MSRTSGKQASVPICQIGVPIVQTTSNAYGRIDLSLNLIGGDLFFCENGLSTRLAGYALAHSQRLIGLEFLATSLA